jgi:predicted site-specific integrase-resolvase
MGVVRKRKVILYARVSSKAQKDGLINQVKYLEENVKDYDQVITDVGSGVTGISNATITFDVVIHETMWVVGIFTALYRYLQSLPGLRSST